MTDLIPFEKIKRVFTNPRDARAFDYLQRRFGTVDNAVALAVSDTAALKDATVITLSANAELTNERVLQFGAGITSSITSSTLSIASNVRGDGDFRVVIATAGDASLGAPLTGFLATREWVIAQGYGSGGSRFTYTSVAASYTETATTGEKIVAVTASGQTVTLPTAVGNTAKLTFKLMVAGTFTIGGNGAQTIDGALTAVLTLQYEAVTIISNNANWIVI